MLWSWLWLFSVSRQITVLVCNRRIKQKGPFSQQLFSSFVLCYGTSKRLLIVIFANDPETFIILLKVVCYLTLVIVTYIECVKRVDVLKEEEEKRKIKHRKSKHFSLKINKYWVWRENAVKSTYYSLRGLGLGAQHLKVAYNLLLPQFQKSQCLFGLWQTSSCMWHAYIHSSTHLWNKIKNLKTCLWQWRSIS